MRMREWVTSGIVAVAATTAAVTPAEAGSMLGGYSVIALGDLTTNSNLHGSALVYGDFQGSTVGASPGGVTAANGDILTVLGDASGNLNVQTGTVRIAGTYRNGHINNNAGSAGTFHIGALGSGGNVNANGGTVHLGTPVDLPAGVAGIAGQAFALQDTLAALTPNASTHNGSGDDLFLDATGVAAGETAVFSIDAADFASVSDQLQIDLGDAAYAVVNVTGFTSMDAGQTVATLAANINGLSSEEREFLAQHVVWNFLEAEMVNISRQFFGSVLAPSAAVWTGADFYGTLVGGRIDLGGQMHLPTTDLPPVPIPTPAAAAPALVGCFALLMRRRRDSLDG